MDRVVSLPDPVVIFVVLGAAIGFLRFNLEIPQGLARPHLTIEWQSGVFLSRMPRLR